MSDPPFSDIDFKNEMTWVQTTLKTVEHLVFSGVSWHVAARV